MGSSLSILKRRLFIAAVALAAAGSAEAQQPQSRPGQAIIFSSPGGDNVSSNLPSLTARPPELPGLANAVQSPGLNLAPPSPDNSLSKPPVVLPAEDPRMQQLRDEQENWALMTPEEILGVPTPEQMLGIPERDAFGQPKSGTVLEQYYERLQELRVPTNNASYAKANPLPHWDFPGNQNLPIVPNIWTPTNSLTGSRALLDQLLNAVADNPSFRLQPAQKQSPGPFGLPQLPGTEPGQPGAEKQFQQLLQSDLLPDNAVKAPAPGGPLFSPALALPKPALGQPATTPIGISFPSLNGVGAVPGTVSPLAGLPGATNMTLAAPVPEWQPAPPPWMLTAPQPGVVPQRKF